jgi:hypothetical protein
MVGSGALRTGLPDCIRDGSHTYASAYEDRGVWQMPKSFMVRMARRALPGSGRGR